MSDCDSDELWGHSDPAEHLAEEERLPNNKFTQNARAADAIAGMWKLALAYPCHDRPMGYALAAGHYGRPDGGFVNPHAFWALGEAAAEERAERRRERERARYG